MQRGSLSGRQFWTKIKSDYNLPNSLDALIGSYDYEREMSFYKSIGLMPGVKRVLKILHNAGIPTGLATSAERIRVDRVLALGHLESYFHSITCASDVRNHKPDPEYYLKSCERLGHEANHVLVIEDSRNGAKAAQAAGCKVAAYHGSMWRYDPFNADLYITSFEQISSLDDLTRAWA